jgi:hypothetical protein
MAANASQRCVGKLATTAAVYTDESRSGIGGILIALTRVSALGVVVNSEGGIIGSAMLVVT